VARQILSLFLLFVGLIQRDFHRTREQHERSAPQHDAIDRFSTLGSNCFLFLGQLPSGRPGLVNICKSTDANADGINRNPKNPRHSVLPDSTPVTEAAANGSLGRRDGKSLAHSHPTDKGNRIGTGRAFITCAWISDLRGILIAYRNKSVR